MANVEAAVISWLNDNVVDWPAYGDAPAELPNKFILVDRTGGGRESMVLDMAEILIEVYHKTSRLEASNQADAIADSITELVSVENITRVKINSIVQLSDTIKQYQRYQIYLDVYNRH